MDKISIIVPIYNCEKYLKRCLESIINQTYNNLEIILLNDGSSDNSLKIIKEYKKKDNRIIVIDKKNTGVSDTRNIGIQKASGKYICFCDSDDVLELKYIEIMHKTIKEKNVDLVKCNYKVIDENNKFISSGNVSDICYKYLNKNKIRDNIIPKCLIGEIPCFSYLLMIKKDKLLVEYPIDIAMMEDVVFYIRLLLSVNNIYVIDDELYTIMFNSEGATNNIKNYERNILNILEVNTYIQKELESNNLKNDINVENLNINNLNAISDFIFKHYLLGDNTIKLCKQIRNDKFIDIIKNTNINKINIQRRIILILIKNKLFITLRLYFILRKVIYLLRRKNS